MWVNKVRGMVRRVSPRRGGSEVQQQINTLILNEANQGKTVVRLKGGDPYFRGGEEQLIAQQANIEFEVVPGVTAAMGAASYCGIPLTHRGLSQSVRFVTGHRVEQTSDLDWPELARSDQTLVIYMGLVGIDQILGQLIAAGRAATTPAVLIENATLTNQRAVFASVDTLPRRLRSSRSPTIDYHCRRSLPGTGLFGQVPGGG